MPSRDTMAPTAASRPHERSEPAMDKHTMLRQAGRTAGITQKQAEEFTAAFLELMTNAIVNNGHLNISHFGTFKVVRRAPGVRRDLNSDDPKATVKVPMGVDVRFVASDRMKDQIREKNPWTGPESSTSTPAS